MRCGKRTYSITKDEDGSLFMMGRTDDIINVAGQPALNRGHGGGPGRCAVIGIADPVKGEVPCGFVVLKADSGPRSRIR